jgi:hypothetical protein
VRGRLQRPTVALSKMTHAVNFIPPCYIIYGDETGTSTATGNFFIHARPGKPVDITEPFTLNQHTFILADGSLSAIKITREGQPPVEITPVTSLTVGPNAWAILQPPVEGGSSLAIMQDGKYEAVLFDGDIPPPPPIHPLGPGPAIAPLHVPEVTIRNGAVYNGLDLQDPKSEIPLVQGLVSVTYYGLFGGGPNETSPAARGKETDGLLAAQIVSFNIQLHDTETQCWIPDTDGEGAAKGLPLVVFGSVFAPSVAIMNENGAATIVKLKSAGPR